MYQIFVVTNKCFGRIHKLVYEDRDIANVVWKDFMRDGNPIITVNENEFKTWNAPFTHQPEVLEAKEWPQWATDLWLSRKNNSGYLGARLIDRDNIGCYELRHRTELEGRLMKIERQFFTYRGEELFTVTEYD